MGCVADELPCDHEGFPFVVTARRVWFYLVPLTIVSWGLIVLFSHTHLSTASVEDLDINSTRVESFVKS